MARGDDSFCEICRRCLCRPHFDRRQHWCRYRTTVSACTYAWYLAKSLVGVVPRGKSVKFRIDHSDTQASETIADLDVEKLKKEILALEPGKNFTLETRLGDVSDRTDDGGINIHIPIRSEGAKDWLLRIPSYADRPEPADMVERVRNSEVLTYKALRAAGVLVPEVYSWGFGTVSKSAGKQHCKHRLNIRPTFFAYTLRKAIWFSSP